MIADINYTHVAVINEASLNEKKTMTLEKMTEFEKMKNALDYDASAPEFDLLRNDAFNLLAQINKLQFKKAQPYVKQLLADIGDDSVICPPFLCEYGKTISIGKGSFLNMGVTMLDNACINIGDNVLVGPNAQFYTPTHPMDYKERRQWEIKSLPINIENDVWIGGNSVICQGVTIGARSIIGAASVVTKDIPADCLYAGSPARLIRKLNQS